MRSSLLPLGFLTITVAMTIAVIATSRTLWAVADPWVIWPLF